MQRPRDLLKNGDATVREKLEMLKEDQVAQVVPVSSVPAGVTASNAFPLAAQGKARRHLQGPCSRSGLSTPTLHRLRGHIRPRLP